MSDPGAVVLMSENASALVEKIETFCCGRDIAGVFVVTIETAAVVVMSETGAVSWGYVRNC